MGAPPSKEAKQEARVIKIERVDSRAAHERNPQLFLNALDGDAARKLQVKWKDVEKSLSLGGERG